MFNNLFGKKKDPGPQDPPGAPGTGLAQAVALLSQLQHMQPSDPDTYPLLNECTRMSEWRARVACALARGERRRSARARTSVDAARRLLARAVSTPPQNKQCKRARSSLRAWRRATRRTRGACESRLLGARCAAFVCATSSAPRASTRPLSLTTHKKTRATHLPGSWTRCRASCAASRSAS